MPNQHEVALATAWGANQCKKWVPDMVEEKAKLDFEISERFLAVYLEYTWKSFKLFYDYF